MSRRIKCIDYLKTIAIIGVIFYHIGVLKNGYLGVEVFFVISGYLFVNGNRGGFENGSFKPVRLCLEKISAFWPLVLIGCVVSLAVGYMGMLPDDYENLSESVVASAFFMNNVLQVLISKDYWDIVNTYKPLMHTWYICVLLQVFVFLSFIIWLSRKIAKRDITQNVLIAVVTISFALYILPFFPETEKFYLFHFRIFEIAFGGLISYFKSPNFNDKTTQLLGNIGLFIILFIIFSGINITPIIMTLLIILSTSIVIWTHGHLNEEYGISEKVSRILTIPGKYSYDIYIWHQIVIAFLYYWIFPKANLALIICVLAITSLLSAFSILIRKKVPFLKDILKRYVFSGALAIVGTSIALVVYLHAGVVRNIPELEIDQNNVHRNMHAEYVDRPYSWNNDFSSDRIHILVMGNSFGRDFANILNESEYSEYIEISYLEGSDATNNSERVRDADFIFYGTNSFSIPSTVFSLPQDKLYIVGNKKFGNSNGNIYFNRRNDDYFSQTIKLDEDFINSNYAAIGKYGAHYIDMLEPVLDGNNVRVFTDDGYFISQDCSHLTKKGAQYYARILNLQFIYTE